MWKAFVWTKESVWCQNKEYYEESIQTSLLSIQIDKYENFVDNPGSLVDKTSKPYTLVGPSVTRPVQDPLAVTCYIDRVPYFYL